MQQFRLRSECSPLSFEDHAAFDENDVAIRELGERSEVFVDDDRGDAGFAHGSNDPPDFLGNQRREAFGCLVENQQVGLVISARPIASICCSPPESCWPPWASVRRAAERFRARARGPVGPAAGAGARRHDEIFPHCKIRKNAAAFGNVSDALSGDQMGQGARHIDDHGL